MDFMHDIPPAKASHASRLDGQLSNALAHSRPPGPPERLPGKPSALAAPYGPPEVKSAPAKPSALDHQEGGHHYTDMKIQPVEYIHANGLPFIEGCVVKYVSRWRTKGGIKDLEKARHFIDLLIELEIKAQTPDEHINL